MYINLHIILTIILIKYFLFWLCKFKSIIKEGENNMFLLHVVVE